MEYTPFLEGNSRLHWLAASPKSNRVLEYVLNRMPQSTRLAAVNTPNLHGQTPLHAACSSRNFPAIETLSKCGALNIEDKFGTKPYDFIADSPLALRNAETA